MSLLDPAQRSARGLAIQAEVSGAQPPRPATLLDESWRDFVYAEVWNRPGLDRRSRYLVSLASAAMSSGPAAILEGYVRGALAGRELTLGELREAALHLAVYGGWSRGAELDQAITRVAGALGLAPAALAPVRAEPWDPAVRHAEGAQHFTAVMTFAGPPPVTPYFDAGILNFVFAEMWCRPGLDQRSRRWITLVGVAESAAVVPIRSHIYAAMASGDCSAGEMQEFVLQYAVHAGWPKGSVIQGVVLEMAKRVAAGLPFEA